jgi:chromate transporter
MTDNNKIAPPTALQLFFLYSKINAVTLGGGYVIVPVMATSLDKKGWMKEADFYDIFAHAQAFPGPIALNAAILAGKKLAGLKGGIAGFFGVVLPPFLAIILVSGILTRYGSLPEVKRFLAGAGAVVPGLVASMVWKMGKKRKWTIPRIAQTAALAIILMLFPKLSLPLMLGGIALFYGIEVICKRSN